MIIRKYGKIKPGKVKCSECDALLKYDVDDIKQYMWGDYRVKCPICGNMIIVYKEVQ